MSKRMRGSLLAVFIFWSGHVVYAQVTLDPNRESPMVFPGIFSPNDNGIEVKFTSSDKIADAALQSCRSCFTATYNPSVSSVTIKRTPSEWTSCASELSDGSGTEADPSIKRCETTIEFRSDTDQVLYSDPIRLYINRQPQVTFNPDDLTKIEFEENSLSSSHVADITVSDPDLLSAYYRRRRIEIISCGDSCPWKLQLVSHGEVEGDCICCSNTSCTSGEQRAERYALSLVRELDYETAAVEQIFLRITDAVNRPERQQNEILKSITVRVIDVQDTPPQFVAYQPFYSVDELQPEGTHLFSVKAIDGDRANPSSVFYELDSQFLNITTNETTGEGDVYIQQRFTIEEVMDSTIILNITAIEDTPQRDRSVISVRILVMDIDNQRAEFFLRDSSGITQASFFSASIEENSFFGSPLQLAPGQQIFIEDRDRGVNAHFQISLSPSDTFEISPSDAQGSAFISIRVKNNTQLDAERIQLYSLTIHTRGDGENPQESSATVQIAVIDVNDHRAFIKDCKEQPIAITVDELVFINKRETVLNVGLESSLSDDDYDIINRNTTRFRLYQFDDPSFTVTESGLVDVVGRLDYETDQFHQVFIEVDNVGRNGLLMTSYCTIHVNITDANDETPELVGSSLQSEYTIDENQLMNFPEIQVLDKDTKAALKFSLRLDRAQGPNGAAVSLTDFDLDQHVDIESSRHADNSTIWGGTLNVIRPFDRETTSYINATVTINDTNADSRLPPQIVEHRIVITVRDVNDNSPKLSFNNDKVNGTLQLEVAEEDVNAVYLFTVTDEDSVPDPSNFQPSLSFPEEFKIYSNYLNISKIPPQRIQLNPATSTR